MGRKHALIIGGTSGLGLELAKMLANEYAITITGRRNDPAISGLRYVRLDLTPKAHDVDYIRCQLDALVEHTDLCIYAPGFYQEGTIDQLSDDQIDAMNSVGLGACQKMLARIMRRQGQLEGFIAITSTSERKPRLKEPVYNGAKGGLRMFAEGVSLDPRIGKTLVAAPAGMKTDFWPEGWDTTTMLDPRWVAEQILANFAGEYRFKHIYILREPPRVEVDAKRVVVMVECHGGAADSALSQLKAIGFIFSNRQEGAPDVLVGEFEEERIFALHDIPEVLTVSVRREVTGKE